MPYVCAICDAENEGDGACQACGAERGARPPRRRPFIIMFGLLLTATGAITLYRNYPPGTLVYSSLRINRYVSSAGTVWASAILFCIGVVVLAVGLYLDNKPDKS